MGLRKLDDSREHSVPPARECAIGDNRLDEVLRHDCCAPQRKPALTKDVNGHCRAEPQRIN